MNISDELARYVEQSPDNFLSEKDAIVSADAGMRFFDAPLVGVARADDPLFRGLQAEGAVGSWFRLPESWLPEAKSVVSVFFPYGPAVKEAKDPNPTDPAPAWLNARIEGERLVKAAGRYLRARLEEEGHAAVIPTDAADFWSIWAPGSKPAVMPDPSVGFTSPWSERHVGFVCGLGTFGLSGCLITEKGSCGRLISLVTDAALPVTPRAYTGIYEYCTFCGVCASRCPVKALDPARGKDVPVCGGRIAETKVLYAPRYACNKCQTGVPCMSGIPEKNKK